MPAEVQHTLEDTSLSFTTFFDTATNRATETGYKCRYVTGPTVSTVREYSTKAIFEVHLNVFVTVEVEFPTFSADVAPCQMCVRRRSAHRVLQARQRRCLKLFFLKTS